MRQSRHLNRTVPRDVVENTTLKQNVQHTPLGQNTLGNREWRANFTVKTWMILNYHSYTIPLPHSSFCYFEDKSPPNLRTSPPKSSPNLRRSPPCTAASNRDLDKSGGKRDIQPDSETRHSCPAEKTLDVHVHFRPTRTNTPPPNPEPILNIIETSCRR